MLDFTEFDSTVKKLKEHIEAYSAANAGTDSALRCAQSALDCSDAGIVTATP